jgi:hypothetical protein
MTEWQAGAEQDADLEVRGETACHHASPIG